MILRAVLVTAGMAILAQPQGVAAANVLVLTNGRAPESSITRDFLRAAFTMRLREWPDGTPLRVFVLPDRDPVHQKFAGQRLGTYPYVLRDIWDRLVFTGTGSAPIVVSSEQEMKDKLRTTLGAIGYLSGPASSDLAAAGIRLIHVEGESDE